MRVKQDHDSADLLYGELDFGCPQLAVANPSEPVIDLGPNYLLVVAQASRRAGG